MRHVAARLSSPWVITREGGSLVRGVYSTALTTGKAERLAAALEARDGVAFNNERNVEIIDGIAVVSIDGPMMRKAEIFTDLSGATSYEWIGAQVDAIAAAHAAGSIKAAVFKFNTPGGEAAGCGICGDKIRALADVMPVEGYAETQASSGGWWLISQCTRITAHRQARLGSMGARIVLMDDAERDAKEGVKEIELVSDISPAKRGTPVDDQVLDRVQTSLNDVAMIFASSVASGRGISVEEAIANFGAGDELIAEKALAAGMVDEIGDLESIIARLGGVTSNPSRPALIAPARGTTTMRNPKAAHVAAPIPAAPEVPAPVVESGSSARCAKCEADMTGKAAYCGGCFDGHGEPDGDDDEDDDAKAAADFGRKALALLGTDLAHADEALGNIKAGALARVEQDEAREAAVVAAKAQAKTDFLAEVKSALGDGRLTLGSAATVLDFLSDEQAESVKASLGASVPDPKEASKTIAKPQTVDTVMASFALAEPTAREVKRVRTFLSARPASVKPPVAHRAPADTKEERAKLQRHLAAVAPDQGFAAKDIKQFAHLSVAEIEARVDANKTQKGA